MPGGPTAALPPMGAAARTAGADERGGGGRAGGRAAGARAAAPAEWHHRGDPAVRCIDRQLHS